MIIDFHNHCFPDKIAAKAVDSLSKSTRTKAFTDGRASSLKSAAASAGVDLSVILPVATSPDQVVKINDRSRCYDGSDGLLSFACMHPDFSDYKAELSRIKAMGYRGVKLHHVFQDTDIDDIRSLRIINECASLGLIVYVHAGLDMGFPGVVRCSPAMIKNALEQVGIPSAKDPYGGYQFIAAHMGGWRNWEEAAQFLPQLNVYIDTSTSLGRLHPRKDDDLLTEEDLTLLDSAGFMRLYDAFGPEHIVFGSDSPWNDILETLDFLRSLPLDEASLKLILGGNAEKLLGLG